MEEKCMKGMGEGGREAERYGGNGRGREGGRKVWREWEREGGRQKGMEGM